MSKYCINCKYIKYSKDELECRHEASVYETDLVTGNKMYTPASIMRNRKHKCGPDANLFEKNESWITKIFGME